MKRFIVNTARQDTKTTIIYIPTRCLFLIAALIFSAGYYSAPIFFTIQELDCIGALSFYNSKNLNCIGALSFYDSKRSIGEVLFFNQFYWSDF